MTKTGTLLLVLLALTGQVHAQAVSRLAADYLAGYQRTCRS